MSWCGNNLELNASKIEGDGHRFPEGKITCRPAADQRFADRSRRQLPVSGYSHILWVGLGDEHQLHPEEGAEGNVIPPAAEEVWPTG